MSDEIQYLSLPSFDSSKPSQPGEPASPPAPGRYRIDGDLGSGGMGAVFKAYDVDLHREVAIKVLHGYEPTPDMLAKFREEAQIGAQLEHPAIVPIYDFGVDRDGRIFIVMKLVRGCALDSCGDLTSLRRIQVVQQIAQALAFAHEKGVIHRDLKPANIMTGAHGEVQIMDWGLAKVLGTPDRPIAVRTARTEGDTTRTMEGTVQGTPHFMAPEQARGEPLDARADLYALGAILYHLLCGEPPVVGKSVEEIIDKVARGDVRPLPASVPRELRAVAAKAMALRPADRYQTATAFHDDLQAYLEGRPGAAWRDSLPTRARKWLKRHPAVGASMLVAVFAALGTLFIMGRRPGTVILHVEPRGTQAFVKTAGSADAPRFIGDGPDFMAKLPPGEYDLYLRCEDYDEGVHRIVVSPGSEARSTYRLLPKWDHYFFSSDPQGAEIILTPKADGDPISFHTPFTIKVPRGEYDVRVALEGYIDALESLTVTGIDQNLQEVYTLEKAGVGRVRVRGVPAGTRVTFERDGSTPRTVTLPHDDPLELPAGRYTVRAEIERHVTDVRTLDVAEGKETSTVVNPRPQELWRTKVESPHVRLLPYDLDANGWADLVVADGASMRGICGYDGRDLWRQPRMDTSHVVVAVTPMDRMLVAVTMKAIITVEPITGIQLRTVAWDESSILTALSLPLRDPKHADLILSTGDSVCAYDFKKSKILWRCDTPGLGELPYSEDLQAPSPGPEGRVTRVFRGTIRVDPQERSEIPITQLIDVERGRIVKTWEGHYLLALADANEDGREDAAVLHGGSRVFLADMTDGRELWTVEKTTLTRSSYERREYVSQRRLLCTALGSTPSGPSAPTSILIRDGSTDPFPVRPHGGVPCMPWPDSAVVFSFGDRGLQALGPKGDGWAFASGQGVDGPMAAADFDADGHPDVAVVLADRSLVCFNPMGSRAVAGAPTNDDPPTGMAPPPLVVQQRFLVEDRPFLSVWDAADYRQLWSGSSDLILLSRDHDGDAVNDVIVGFAGDRIALVSTVTGQILKRGTATLSRPFIALPDADDDGRPELLARADGIGYVAYASSDLLELGRWEIETLEPAAVDTNAGLTYDFDSDERLDLVLVQCVPDYDHSRIRTWLSRSNSWTDTPVPDSGGSASPFLRRSSDRVSLYLGGALSEFIPANATIKRLQRFGPNEATVIGEDDSLWIAGFQSRMRARGGVPVERWNRSDDRWVRQWVSLEASASQPQFLELDGDDVPDAIMLGRDTRFVLALAGATGTMLWSFPLGERAGCAPVAVNGKVVLRTADRWWTIDPRVGKCDFTWIAGEGTRPGGGRCLIERK